MAYKWAGWLHNSCRLGGPHHLRAGGRIKSGPQMGHVVTYLCLLGGLHRFKMGGRIRGAPQVGQVAT